MAAKKAAAPVAKEAGFLDEILEAVDSVADVVNGDIFDGLNPTTESTTDEPEAPSPAAPAQPRSPGGTFLPAPAKKSDPEPQPGGNVDPAPKP